MPKAPGSRVALFYQEGGGGEGGGGPPGPPLPPRRYRPVTFNARGYPPSDVPEDPAAYSQRQAVEDIRGLLDHLGIEKAHVCGLSMGGYATLHFGLTYPERALSLLVAGCGYGSGADREAFRHDTALVVRKFEEEGMERVAEFYGRGPARVQLLD